jgi:teichuronopeptide biosynthesis TupA-like protein
MTLTKWLPDIAVVANRYRKVHGHWPRLWSPKTFTEKVARRIVFDRRPILRTFADKVAVRDYVAAILPGSLPPVYGVYGIYTLPRYMQLQDFVLKATHGSGWVKLIHGTPNWSELIPLCESWLNQEYYSLGREWAYKDLPRRIMVEEFIDNGTGEAPDDYKFFVFGGKVEMIQVDTGRFKDHRRNLYTRNWNKIEVEFGYPGFLDPCSISRHNAPKRLEEMIAIAEKLSQGIDFVRVDLYETDKKVYFGEMTMTPEGGIGKFNDRAFDVVLGTNWIMDL